MTTLVDITHEFGFPGGVEHKHVVKDDTGITWLMKMENPRQEVIGNVVAAALGFAVPKVKQHDKFNDCETCKYYCEGSVLIEWLHNIRPLCDVLEEPDKPTLHDDDLLRMELLDYVLGNDDRHTGNILIDGVGRLIPIDHSYIKVGQPFYMPSPQDVTPKVYYLDEIVYSDATASQILAAANAAKTVIYNSNVLTKREKKGIISMLENASVAISNRVKRNKELADLKAARAAAGDNNGGPMCECCK